MEVTVLLLLLSFSSCNSLSNQTQAPPAQGDVRLVGSGNGGRLEYYRFNEWTSVCLNDFELPAADWVCRKLGFKYAEIFRGASLLRFETGRSTAITKIVCNSRGCSAQSCISTHSKDIAVVCTNDTSPIRLMSESGRSNLLSAGRLEIKINGVWGTVCSSSFSKTEADVACRHLGFVKANSYTTATSIGYDPAPFSFPVFHENLVCSTPSSSNDDLRSCLVHGRKRKCTHADDVILSCAYPGSLRLSQPSRSGNELQVFGRLEIFYNGMWGAVCNKPNFTMTSAAVACKQLGFSNVDCIGSSSQLGMDSSNSSIAFFLDDVKCKSTSVDVLTNCTDQTLGSTRSSCRSSSEFVALACTAASKYNKQNYCQSKLSLAGAITGAVFAVLIITTCCVVSILVTIKKILLPSHHHIGGSNAGLIALAAVATSKSEAPPAPTTLTNPAGLQPPPLSSKQTTQLSNAAYPRQARTAEQQMPPEDYSKQPQPQFQINSGSALHESPPPSYNAKMDQPPPFVPGQAAPNYPGPSY